VADTREETFPEKNTLQGRNWKSRDVKQNHHPGKKEGITRREAKTPSHS